MRKGIRRLVLGALLVVLAVALVLGYRAYQVYRDVSNITGIHFITLTAEPHATAVANVFGNHRMNILVLGSDNDRKIEEKFPLTQSMIVVSIDPVHDTVNLLSIPRDFYVDIPGFGMDKIDVAAKDGGRLGISLARTTVEQLLGRKIDYTVWVGLDGFRSVIDTFGGITIDVTHPIVDDFYPDDTQPGNPYAWTRIFIPPGWRHLSGRQTLQYVRSRHADAKGDFGRSARQQELLLALRHKANGFDLLFKIPAIASELQGKVKTDLSPTQVFDLARLSRHIDLTHIHRFVLSAPTYSSYGTSVTSGSILVPNMAKIRPLLAQIFAPIDSAPPSQARRPTPAPAKRTPEHSRSQPHATVTPAGGTALSRLPGRILYAAGGTFFIMGRDLNTQSLFGPHVGSYMNAADMPTLSPNGKSVVFLRFSRYATDLFRYAISTDHNPTQLTHDRWADPKDIHDNVWAAFPSWLGRGREILYSSDLYKRTTLPSDTRPIDLAIYAMDPNGNNVRQVTQPAVGAGGDTDPQWRGTGTQYLYDHWAYRTQNTPQGPLAVGQPYSQLVLRDIANPNAIWYLTPPGLQIVQPALDRKGRQVTYVQASGTSSSSIVVARIDDTKNGPKLTGSRILIAGEVAQPAFSPDGKWISFLQADGDGFSLWVARTSGGPATKLSSAGAGIDSISRPIWFP